MTFNHDASYNVCMCLIISEDVHKIHQNISILSKSVRIMIFLFNGPE